MKLRAIAGAVIWVMLFCANLLGAEKFTLIEVLFLLAPLVIVPLGLELIENSRKAGRMTLFGRIVTNLQFPCAILAVVSFFLAPGMGAASLAAVWLFFCGSLALCGLFWLIRDRPNWFDGVNIVLSFLYISIGAAWLVASRAGLTPMGFQEPIVLLTAVHFHYAGFAAPILTIATNIEMAKRGGLLKRIFIFVAFGILAGPGLLAIGFVTSSSIKLIAATIIVVSESALGGYFLLIISGATPPARRILLGLSAASVFFTMALVAAWSVGDYRHEPILDLYQMEWMHGTANAMGFVLCGLLGWTVIRSPRVNADAKITGGRG